MAILMIGGTGRSGTTILKKILSKHPNIASVPEWRFMIDPDGLIDFYQSITYGWSPYSFDVKLKRLEKALKKIGTTNYLGAGISYLLKQLNLRRKIPFRLSTQYSEVAFVKKYCPAYNSIVDELINNLIDFKYKGQWFGEGLFSKNNFYYSSPKQKSELLKIINKFYKKLIENALETQGKDYFLEKNTFNILWFDKILEMLPESKLVHIYRDPRDVVASFMEQPWSPEDPHQAAIFYKDIIESWWNIREKLPLDSYFEISLEQLSSNTEETLRNVCDFYGIEWDNSFLSIDLSRSNTGRWKKNLTKAQQDKVNSILKEHIDILEYS